MSSRHSIFRVSLVDENMEINSFKSIVKEMNLKVKLNLVLIIF